jgi:DMSO/TMAO reductase YedYZ molybdopterin-dependent catalytic subunit
MGVVRQLLGRRGRRSALAAVVATALGLSVGELLTALVPTTASPFVAVGNKLIDRTPHAVKDWAVAHFGTADKPVLLSGIAVGLLVATVIVGLVAGTRPRVGVAMFLAVGLVGAVTAVFDRSASAGLPTQVLVAAVSLVVGLLAFLVLLRLARRPERPTLHAASTATEPGDGIVKPFDRRVFLLTATALGIAAAAGEAVGQAVSRTSTSSTVALPRPADPAKAIAAGTVLTVPGITSYTTPNESFYRVDTALRIPRLTIADYQLRIHGLVDNPRTYSFAELLARRLVERRITLTCVSNPVGGPYAGNATWLGVPLKELLAEAGVQDGADAVKSTSADKMTIGTPLQAVTDGRDALVALGMNGAPLPAEHGFPVRMVVPGLYGYVSATKWLVDLEVTRFADFKAYWTTRGYAERAPVKTAARIDVPRSFARVRPGPVDVAGVAWAQHRGISKVQVQVDDEPWQDADLAAADGIDTWRQWRWSWTAGRTGNHRLQVRATDADGNTQDSRRAPVAPDGATGWHSVSITVET